MGGEEQAPPSIEEDAASLAEAVIGRAGGDPQTAVAILDTAADLIMQSTQEEPMMAAGGGYMQTPQGMYMGGDLAVDPRRRYRPSINIPTNTLQPLQPPPPLLQGGSPQARPSQGMMPQGGSPLGMNMGGGIYPRYAFAGEYLGDESDTLRQMIMDNMQTGRTLTDEDLAFHLQMLGSDSEDTGIITDYDTFDTLPDRFWEALASVPSDRDLQEGRTMSDKDLSLALTQSGRRAQSGRGISDSDRDREEKFWEAYEANPDAFSKDAEYYNMLEDERKRKEAAERAKAYRSR
jgi:hypothetical protein